MKIRCLLFALMVLICFPLSAQQIDLNKVGSTFENKPVTLSGGLSFNNVFYQGNIPSGRQDWTYALSGTVNINLYQKINIPLSVNITNLGANFSYPSLPNRLSIHPTYKWITAHIGDVAMSFSPYTLNGHQFTGAGLELDPKGRFKVSLMGGRLMRKVDYDPASPYITPNFRRIGAGAKVEYRAEDLTLGAIYFTAKDIEEPSMYLAMDSLGISPKQNHVLSLSSTLNVIDHVTFQVEHAISLMTRDLRDPYEEGNFIENLMGGRQSTSTYHATNARLNYQLEKNTIGFGYERIDPEYATLGAYYFNNDYENITLNYARPFLKGDKANMALSFGLQHDNLDNDKVETSNRYVGSLSLSYAPVRTCRPMSTIPPFKVTEMYARSLTTSMNCPRMTTSTRSTIPNCPKTWMHR